MFLFLFFIFFVKNPKQKTKNKKNKDAFEKEKAISEWWKDCWDKLINAAKEINGLLMDSFRRFRGTSRYSTIDLRRTHVIDENNDSQNDEHSNTN